MKNFLLIIGCLVSFKIVAQQRVVAEATINYSIAADSSNTDKGFAESLNNSSKTVYIKGNESRVDLISKAFKQSSFFDKSKSEAVVLREIGDNKYLTRLSKEVWLKMNQKYEEATLVKLNEEKSILGFECKKAIIQLKDKSEIIVYYTLAITPSVKEYEYQFKNIPGFVLEYNTVESGNIIIYRATKINLSPVPSHYFDKPTTGYRLLDY
jgi:GLPGLI family protein